MSAANTNSSCVRRLLDMVIEEVSLVDRAANKRRFLVVKRSEEMDINEAKEVSKDEAQAEAQEAQVEPAESHTGGDEGDTGQEADQGEEESGALQVVARALESLTNAVENLTGASESDEEVSLADLAAQFKEIAEQLAATAEDAGDDDEPEDAPDSEEEVEQEQDAPDVDAQNDLAALLVALNDVLKPIGALLGKGEIQKAQAPLPVEADDDERIGTLMNAISSLTKLYGKQQQRLARIEKSFGLPNSQPAGEGERGKGSGSESWPLDLNTPVDRDSVDKSVSFHD